MSDTLSQPKCEWKETDFGRIPAHWNISTVKEKTEYVRDYVANGSFASLAENVNYKNTPDYAVLIRLTDYNNGFKGNFVYVDEHAYNFLRKSKLKGGEIIISNVGAYSGTVFLAPKLGIPMTLGPNAVMMEFKDGNDFYFHWLKSPAGQFSLEGIISGSAQPKFNKTSFRAMEIPVPPIEEQRAIASVLSSLDDKIDLLHLQNQTLEQMAETLYDAWFEECDWTSRVSDLIDLQNGYAFKSKSFQDFGEDRVLKIKNISGGIVDIETTDFVSHGTVEILDEKFSISTGDILFAMTGAKIGKMGIIPKTDYKLWLNQRVGLFKEKYYGSRFLAYLHLKSDYGKDYIENTATGSAQPNISGTGIENCEFPEISEQEIIDYSNQLAPLYEKVIFNLGQIQKLEALRNTLLPKLMSGEIRIDTDE